MRQPATPLPATDWRPAIDGTEPETISLPDGRTLAYETYGDPDGDPVLFCHGTPGSRLLGRLLDTPASDAGVHLLAPDRPGMGQSTDAPQTLADWPADVGVLFDRLGIDDVGVLGFSGGGPFALACHDRPDVDGVGLVGSVGPPEVGKAGPTQQFVSTLARYAPRALGSLFRVQRWLAIRRDPDYALRLVADEPPETGTLDADEIARLVRADFLTAVERGPSGLVRELRQVAQPWPFALADVGVPVAVYQGRRDANVAPATGRALVDRLPDATLELVDADHLGSLLDAGSAALRDVR